LRQQRDELGDETTKTSKWILSEQQEREALSYGTRKEIRQIMKELILKEKIRRKYF
jgi:hypothetical protein